MKSADIILSKRYARAYMDLDGRAFDRHGDSAAKTALAELETVCAAIERFRGLFGHPLAGHEEKSEIFSRVLPAELKDSRAASFLRLLVKENRFYLLDGVRRECGLLYDAYAGRLRAKAVSRHRLGEEEEQRVAAILSAATGKKVLLSHEVSEKIVGGMELRLGDLLVDATVKGRLERLKKSVLTQ